MPDQETHRIISIFGDADFITTRPDVGVYEVEWQGLNEHDGPLDGDYDLETVQRLFAEHGFTSYAPRRRNVYTAARRAIRKATGVSDRKIVDVSDVLVVPEGEKVDAQNELGATAKFTPTHEVLVDKKAGAIVTTAAFAPTLGPRFAEQKERLKGYDIKKCFARIVEENLGGILKRPGEYYIPNDEGERVAGMRRFIDLIKALGGRASVTPIRDEEHLFEYVAFRAAEELSGDFEAFEKTVRGMLDAVASDGRKVKADTVAEYSQRYEDLVNKWKWFADRFGIEREKLAQGVDRGSERAQKALLRLMGVN